MAEYAREILNGDMQGRKALYQKLGRPLVGQADNNADDLDLENSNPYAWLTDFDDETEEVRANISTSLNYQIIKGLKYQLRGGLDFRTKEGARWYGPEIFKGGQVNGDAVYSNLRRYTYVIDNLLMCNKRIKRIHNINATAGTLRATFTKSPISRSKCCGQRLHNSVRS